LKLGYKAMGQVEVYKAVHEDWKQQVRAKERADVRRANADARAAFAADCSTEVTSADEVAAFISGIHSQLVAYAQLFSDNAISARMLVGYGDGELETLGIENKHHREAILDAVDKAITEGKLPRKKAKSS
jgi:hypothetical protein